MGGNVSDKTWDVQDGLDVPINLNSSDSSGFPWLAGALRESAGNNVLST
jgi:hypothetical protein